MRLSILSWYLFLLKISIKTYKKRTGCHLPFKWQPILMKFYHIIPLFQFQFLIFLSAWINRFQKFKNFKTLNSFSQIQIPHLCENSGIPIFYSETFLNLPFSLYGTKRTVTYVFGGLYLSFFICNFIINIFFFFVNLFFYFLLIICYFIFSYYFFVILCFCQKCYLSFSAKRRSNRFSVWSPFSFIFYFPSDKEWY